MEQRLINKLSAVTEEEKRLLSGGDIDKSNYAVGKDFSVNAARVVGAAPYISQRPHTRFAPFPLHSHNFVEMVTVINGRLVHRINDREISLSSGDILIMNKHVMHSVDRAETDDLGINFIMSDSFLDALAPEIKGTVFEDFARENAKRDGEPMFLHFSSKGEKQIENIMENLLFELTDYDKDNHILTSTVALLFKYLSLKEKRLLLQSTKCFTLEQRRKMQIMSYISSYKSSATLTELAKKMKLSPPYLSKVIVDYFGKSFKEILLDERMNAAKRLLLESDMSVGEIIYSIGYENESYFHREFKKRFGKTPLTIRRQNNPELTLKKEKGTV